MDEHELAELVARQERRTQIGLEERHIEALEQIADALIGVHAALVRIGDNV